MKRTALDVASDLVCQILDEVNPQLALGRDFGVVTHWREGNLPGGRLILEAVAIVALKELSDWRWEIVQRSPLSLSLRFYRLTEDQEAQLDRDVAALEAGGLQVPGLREQLSRQLCRVDRRHLN